MADSNNSGTVANDSAAGPNEFVYEIVPEPVMVLMRTGSWIIIVLNVIVLACLAAGSSKFPKMYWLQIVCLSINDLMAGVSIFAVSFVDYTPLFQNSIFACSLFMAIFQATQMSSLFNILGIGIHRYVIIRSMDSNQPAWRSRHTVLVNMAAWLTSALFCTIPYLLWLVPASEFRGYGGCSMETVFGANFPSVMKVYFSGFLFPLLLTNIIYSVIYCLLRRRWNRSNYLQIQSDSRAISSVAPEANLTLVIPRPTFTYTNNSSRVVDLQAMAQSPMYINNKKKPTLPEVEGSPATRKSANLPKIHGNGSLALMYVTPKAIDTDAKCRHGQGEDTNEARNVNPNSTSVAPGQSTSGGAMPSTSNGGCGVVPSNRSRAARHQQTAFALLCTLLILVNLFTWPAISILFVGSLNPSWRLSRALKFPVFTIISLNSLINPLVYSIRVKEFRGIIVPILQRARRRIQHAMGVNVVLPTTAESQETAVV